MQKIAAGFTVIAASLLLWFPETKWFGLGAVAVALVLLAVDLRKEKRSEKAIRSLIEYLTQLQDGVKLPPTDMEEEGSIAILQSEIYKLVLYLQEQSGNAQKEKRYIADMLSDISHQIKTPLTAITLMTDLLQAPDISEAKRKEFLQNIEKQTEKITWLIRNLLTLSQLEANQLHLKRKPIAAQTLLTESRKSVELLAEAKEVELIANYKKEPEDYMICCDHGWTQEALTNIIKNCVEHTPAGGRVAISLSWSNLATTITIEDNGSGIAKEDIPHIFERFYKGKNSSRDSVGIGLAMARQILLQQDGTISCESTEGVGTRFVIRFYNDGKANVE